jgi:hypothetical protein
MNASLRPETAPGQLSLSVPAAGPAGQTWWNRNWIRVVVAGCCGAVALFLGGIILIVASKATGTWVFSTLTIRLKTTGEQISLADKAPPPSPTFPLQSK